tara:strand:+ start:52 stop:213 length:162 start_codon:yes stop_codon:yes gene_type:complete
MKEKDLKTLKIQIGKGKSLNEVVMAMGKSKSTILKKANEMGLKFKNKTHWENL